MIRQTATRILLTVAAVAIATMRATRRTGLTGVERTRSLAAFGALRRASRSRWKPRYARAHVFAVLWFVSVEAHSRPPAGAATVGRGAAVPAPTLPAKVPSAFRSATVLREFRRRENMAEILSTADAPSLTLTEPGWLPGKTRAGARGRYTENGRPGRHCCR